MMNETNTPIESRVMASVAAIYFARRLSSPTAMKSCALLISLIGIATFASLPHVLANFIHVESQGLPATFTFLFNAITKTSIMVQVALVVGVVALLSLLRDAVRPMSRTPTFAS